MSESYKVYASQEYVDNKFNDVSGLPAGAKPNQYLVTDGEGNAKWEDKLAYTETGMKELLAETSFTIEVDSGWTVLNMGKLVVGQKYTVTFDGAVYDAECNGDNGLPAIGGTPADWSSYPFVVYNGNDGNRYCIVEKAGTHTISISGAVETVHKLSGKYVEGMGWSEPTPPLLDAKGVPFDINLDWGGYGVMIPASKPIIVGKTYTVVLDGVTYENLVAVDNDPGASIGGNPSGSLSEGVPFSVFNYSGVLQVNVRTGNTHDITIILEEETIHPIDKKYLPSGAVSGYIVFRYNAQDDVFSCNMTVEQYQEHLKNFTLDGGCFVCSAGAAHYDSGVYYKFKQFLFERFETGYLSTPDDCDYTVGTIVDDAGVRFRVTRKV